MRNQLKIKRLMKGLSQIELAKLSGISPASLSLIERDLVDPKPLAKKAIATVLEVNVVEIFPEDKDISKEKDDSIF